MYHINNSFQKYGVHVAVALFYQLFETEDGGSTKPSKRWLPFTKHRLNVLNHLPPNGHYMGRTAQLTSRCCILYIYSTNIRSEYFKHGA